MVSCSALVRVASRPSKSVALVASATKRVPKPDLLASLASCAVKAFASACDRLYQSLLDTGG